MRNYSINRLGTVDAEIEHDVLGWIPTTLTPEESASLIAEGQVTIAAYVEPVLSVEDQILAIEQSITARNMRAALLGDEYALGVLSDAEAAIAALRE